MDAISIEFKRLSVFKKAKSIDIESSNVFLELSKVQIHKVWLKRSYEQICTMLDGSEKGCYSFDSHICNKHNKMPYITIIKSCNYNIFMLE